MTLPGRDPAIAALPGTQTVEQAGGILVDVVRAYRNAPDASQSLDRTRRIDASTGLLIETIERRTIRIGGRIRTTERIDRMLPVF